MSDDKLEALMRRMRLYNMRAAKDANGNPVLTHIANNPKLSYIAIEDFLALMEKKGWELDDHAMVINRPTEVTAKKTPAVTKIPAPDAKPANPEFQRVWTEAELDMLTWKDIRALAKIWDDVPGNIPRDTMTPMLVGKPKNP